MTIDVSVPKPKVNGEQLKNFAQKHVQLLVERVENGQWKSVDGKLLEIVQNPDEVPSPSEETKFVEVEGVVLEGGDKVKATKMVAFGNDVDAFAYNEMTKTLHANAREMIL